MTGMKYSTLEGKREDDGNINELWVVIGNEYIDPEIYDGVVEFGLPVVELQIPAAIQSWIDDIQHDIDMISKDQTMDLADAEKAIEFLKSYLPNK